MVTQALLIFWSLCSRVGSKSSFLCFARLEASNIPDLKISNQFTFWVWHFFYSFLFGWYLGAGLQLALWVFFHYILFPSVAVILFFLSCPHASQSISPIWVFRPILLEAISRKCLDWKLATTLDELIRLWWSEIKSLGENFFQCATLGPRTDWLEFGGQISKGLDDLTAIQFLWMQYFICPLESKRWKWNGLKLNQQRI